MIEEKIIEIKNLQCSRCGQTDIDYIISCSICEKRFCMDCEQESYIPIELTREEESMVVCKECQKLTLAEILKRYSGVQKA